MEKVRWAVSAALSIVALTASAVDLTQSGEYSFSIEAKGSTGDSEVYRIVVPPEKSVHIAVSGYYEHGADEFCQAGMRFEEQNYDFYQKSISRTFRISETKAMTFYANVSADGYWYTDRRGATYWKEYSNAYCLLRYTITLTYEDLRPDLTVKAFTVTPNAAGAVDETIHIGYTIRNIGGKASAACAATLLSGASILRTVAVPALPVGGSVDGSMDISGLAAGVYEFTLAADSGNSIAEADETNNEKTLSYRVFERSPYTVQFRPNGGSGRMPNRIHICGTPQSLPANAFAGPKSFDGVSRRFAGWATDLTDSVTYVDKAVVTNLTFTPGGNVILYAVWKARFYLEYDGNGGFSDAPPIKCEQGESIALTDQVPVRDGYVFMGWNLKTDGTAERMYACGETVSDLTAEDGEALRLYAMWSPISREITFSGQGHYVPLAERSRVVSGDSGCGDLPTPLTSRYAFVGWYTEPTGGVSVASSNYIANSTTLYAHSECLKNRVTFDANGGFGFLSDVSAWTDDIVRLPSNAFRRDGYQFIGWNSRQSEAEKGEVEFPDGGLYKCEIRGVATLYAVWQENVLTTYHFDSNGGVGSMPDVILTNATLSLADMPRCAFTREGFSFVTWNRTRKGAANVWNCTPIWGRELACGACVGDARFYTVALNHDESMGTHDWSWRTVDGLSFLQTPNLSYGQKSSLYIIPQDMQAKCYRSYRYRYRNSYHYYASSTEYNDMYLDNGGAYNYKYQKDWLAVTNKSYEYSMFSYKKTVSETENGNVGLDRMAGTYNSFVMVDPVCFIQLDYSLSAAAVQTNIAFATSDAWTCTVSSPWLTVAKCASDGHRANVSCVANDTLDARTATVVTSEGLTFTISQRAGLTPVEIVLLTDGGVLAETNVLRAAAGCSIGTLPIPSRYGYDFAGWYTAEEGGTPITSDSVLTEDSMLHAHWTVASYTVRFDANGTQPNPACRYVPFNTPVGVLPEARRSGYAFLGWFYQGIRVDSSTRIAGDVTFSACWQKADCASADTPDWLYRVTFLPNGGVGNGISPLFALPAKVVTLPACTFSFPGKRFAGWQSSNGKRYDDGVMFFNLAQPGETVTMTAIWK